MPWDPPLGLECYVLYPYPHDPPVDRVEYAGNVYKAYDRRGAAIAFTQDARPQALTSLPGVVILPGTKFRHPVPTSRDDDAAYELYVVYSEPMRLKMLCDGIGLPNLLPWLRDATRQRAFRPSPPVVRIGGQAFPVFTDESLPRDMAYMIGGDDRVDADAFATMIAGTFSNPSVEAPLKFEQTKPMTFKDIEETYRKLGEGIVAAAAQPSINTQSPEDLLELASGDRLDRIAFMAAVSDGMGVVRGDGETDNELRARVKKAMMQRYYPPEPRQRTGELEQIVADTPQPDPKPKPPNARAAVLEIDDDEG